MTDREHLYNIASGPYYISVYHPICGWKAIMYGPEGPEQTGLRGYETPMEAYQEAIHWAEADEVRLKDLTFQKCLTCGGWMVNGRCDDCASQKLRAEMEAMRAKRKG